MCPVIQLSGDPSCSMYRLYDLAPGSALILSGPRARDQLYTHRLQYVKRMKQLTKLNTIVSIPLPRQKQLSNKLEG